MAFGSIEAIPLLFDEGISAVTATPTVTPGTERYYDGCWWKYIYNIGTSTLTTKHVCVCTGYSAGTVTISSVAQDGSISGLKPVGVCVNADIDPTYYGWVMTKGVATLTSDGGTAVAEGNMVYAVAAGNCTAASGRTGTSNAAVMFAQAIEATTTAGTFHALINCL